MSDISNTLIPSTEHAIYVKDGGVSVCRIIAYEVYATKGSMGILCHAYKNHVHRGSYADIPIIAGAGSFSVLQPCDAPDAVADMTRRKTYVSINQFYHDLDDNDPDNYLKNKDLWKVLMHLTGLKITDTLAKKIYG